MQYNFVIIHSRTADRTFARKILRSIRWINRNKYPQYSFTTFHIRLDENFLNEIIRKFSPENTIIHPRCANPEIYWTQDLRKLENLGYKVVNSVDCIELTSDKLACSLHLQGKVNHPKSWEWNKSNSDNLKTLQIDNILDNLWDGWGNDKFLIAKPITSLEQGANVKKININNYWDIGAEIIRADELVDEIEKVPGNKIVIQEYIPYTALHRVIVINGKALPYTFVDYANDPRKTDWKVSCCLNRTTMQLNQVYDEWLVDLAEQTQKEIGGVINFIDIFELADGSFTISEINTACSLNIHEKLAKQAGRGDWNIHSRIAKQLVKELLG